jgi:Zn-dependent protease with chaperone function
MTRNRSRLGSAVWPAAALAVLTHLAVCATAVVELVRLDWLVSEPWEFIAVSAVAGSGVLALAGAARVIWPAIRGGRALRRLLRAASGPLPAALRAAAAPLGIANTMDVVGTDDAFAVTHGLIRPRILVSSGLVEALDPTELTAVLVHERHHLQCRDPLRLLAARLLAGYGWFLPLLRWWARRLTVRREVAADRAATASAGVAAVAGALLKLAEHRMPAAAAAAANPVGDLPERIANLEGVDPAHRTHGVWWLAGASVANLLALSAAAVCCVGLGVAMAGGMA